MLAAFFVRDPRLIKTPSGVSGGQAGRACEIAAQSGGVRGSAPYCREGTHVSGEDCPRAYIHRKSLNYVIFEIFGYLWGFLKETREYV